jgi:RNA polymerase sigma factor (sigma-70 family)
MDRLPPPSDSELLALCGRGDAAAWDDFVTRFNRRIVLYVARERRTKRGPALEDESEAVRDLTQEVYVRLLANDRRALREFRGASEYAVLAYLSRIVRAVVTDRTRRDMSQKRSVTLEPLNGGDDEHHDAVPLRERLPAGKETLPDRMLAERLVPERLRELVEASSPGTNAARDALIFRLYALEGLSAREIAALPVVGMTVIGVEAVIRRTRDRLRSALGDTPAPSV